MAMLEMRFSRLIASRHPISLLHTLLPLGPVNSYKKLSDEQEHVRALLLLHTSTRVPQMSPCQQVTVIARKAMGSHATVISTNIHLQYLFASMHTELSVQSRYIVESSV